MKEISTGKIISLYNADQEDNRDSGSFLTHKRETLELTFNGIVGNERHYGRTVNPKESNTRRKFVNDSNSDAPVLEQRQIAIIDMESLERILEILQRRFKALNQHSIEQRFDENWYDYLARRLGTNVLLGEIELSPDVAANQDNAKEGAPDIYKFHSGTNFGPPSPEGVTSIKIECYNRTCARPGKLIQQDWPDLKVGDVGQAVGDHRGLLGYTYREGEISEDDDITFYPQNSQKVRHY